MKTKILLILAIMAIRLGVTAQTPYTFNYQSVVRDAGGLLLVNKSVGVQITILQGSVTGATTYQETFSLNTNDFALINLQVGSGNVVSGDMSTIDWSNGPYFMEVAMDFTGGNSYVTMGATQLVSVPYALHAKTAENTFSGDYNDLANSPTNVSAFTNDAGYLMMEMDGDSTNELQAISLSNDTLYLSNGGFVVLPTVFDGQYSSLTGAPVNVSAFTNDSGYLTVEQDSSVTNEIQIMTLVNDTIFLTNGGFVKLPPPIFGFDGRYVSLTGKPTNVSFFTNDAGYLTTELDGDSTNEIQTLTFSNDSLHLSSGGDVDLSGYDNSVAIGVNATNIATNTSGIATNVTAISANTTNIGTNTTGIATNSTAISGNSTNITTNTGNIATNTSGIATNVTAISTNATNIGTNTTGIATNSTAISGNTTNITTNTGNIATNTSGIATNVTAISTNSTNIGTNTTGIATNSTAISGNSTNITTNTGNIATNTSGIATNVTAISANATNIGTNTTGIATNSTAISGNTTNITTNTGNIATNASGIATNVTGIATNVTNITANTTSINNHVTADLDLDATNEIQTLSLAGTTLSISGANSVDLQDASVWDTNSVGAMYSGKIGVGGAPLNYKALTIHTDSLGLNGNGLLQYGKSNAFNYFELKDRDSGKRISIGMADTGSFKSAFTVGTNGGSGWTDPMIVAIGAPNNSFRMLENGNVGFGVSDARTKVHASGDSMVIAGYSTGQHTDNWVNVGTYGETQTDSNPGRGISGHVYGANYGLAVRGEAATDMENQGVSGIALSKPGNTINQYGVYGEARKEWSQSNSGTGSHWGGYFLSTGEGAFTVGAAGFANTPGTGTNRGVSGVANSNTASGNTGTIGFAEGSIAGTNRGAFGRASNSTGTNYGMHGVATGTTGNNSTGVYGYSDGNTPYNSGVDGTTEATGATNIGAGGYAYGTNTGGNKNYGLYAYAQNADTNYGVYSTVTGADNVNYGIYSEVSGGTVASYALFGKNNSTEGTASTDSHYGIRGEAIGVNTLARNWGISGYATGSGLQNTAITAYTNGSGTHNLGVQGTASGTGTNNYAVYGSASNGTNNYAGYFLGDVTITGNLNVTGSIAKGSGTFKIDHPLDPENKYLVHSFVESDEMMNVYSGNVTTDANGFATVDLPSYFEAANKDFRYQLTVIGSFAQAIIKEEVASNKFVIQTNSPNVKVSWQVSGVRSDKYADAHRVVPELDKTKKGTYLHPELFGATEERSENAESNNIANSLENNENSTNPGIENMQELLETKSKTNSVPETPQAESMIPQGRKQPKAEKNQAKLESKMDVKGSSQREVTPSRK